MLHTATIEVLLERVQCALVRERAPWRQKKKTSCVPPRAFWKRYALAHWLHEFRMEAAMTSRRRKKKREKLLMRTDRTLVRERARLHVRAVLPPPRVCAWDCCQKKKRRGERKKGGGETGGVVEGHKASNTCFFNNNVLSFSQYWYYRTLARREKVGRQKKKSGAVPEHASCIHHLYLFFSPLFPPSSLTLNTEVLCV